MKDFIMLTRFGGVRRAAIKKSGFACKDCRRGFSNRGDYLDLTILEGTKVYDEDTTPGEEIFRCVV